MSNEENWAELVKKQLKFKFKIKFLRNVNYILGMRVRQIAKTVEIDQEVYIGQILNCFGMQDNRPSNTPMEKR